MGGMAKVTGRLTTKDTVIALSVTFLTVIGIIKFGAL